MLLRWFCADVNELNDLISISLRFGLQLCSTPCAVQLSTELFHLRLTRQLASLHALLKDSPDPELLFFKVRWGPLPSGQRVRVA